MKKTFYIVLSLCLLAFMGNFIYSGYLKMSERMRPITINGTIVKKPKNIPNFTLNHGHGETYDDSKLLNHWTVMFFGYTRCPDICPGTLKTLSSMYKNLSDLPAKLQPKVIFVSIDSEHDHNSDNSTDNNAAKYSQYFNNNFIGLTGSKSQIKELANGLGVVANKIDIGTKDEKNYIFDHSSTLYVINPRGQLQAILTGPHKTEELTKNMKLILNKFG